MTNWLPHLDNLQANIVRGSSSWQCACYVFIRIADREGGRDLTSSLLASGHVGSAASVFPTTPEVNINIAFSHDGLAQLETSISDSSRYKRDFLLRPRHHESPNSAQDAGTPGTAFESGMRSAELGDTWPTHSRGTYRWGDGSVANAWWSDDAELKPWQNADHWPHMLVWISATQRADRDATLAEIRTLINETDGAELIGCQFAEALPEAKEHFGFVDGVSQPAIEHLRPGKPGDGKLSSRGWEGLKVGEFIVGYSDESHNPIEEPEVTPVAKDGTFLVYRKIRQDVQAFNAASTAMSDDSGIDPTIFEAKMMGRKHDGSPLVVPPGAPHSQTDESLWNDFTYSNDPDGLSCPLGSHVRRANPRDDLHFEGRRVNRHRIIRRGMTYGEPYDPDVAEGDVNRGLIFIAFNAKIEDQFEFIQKHWLNGGRTFRLGDDADPIAGNGDEIRIVINGEHPVLHREPQPFTKFLGGDYFFVPSISMLNQIASRA